MPELDFALVADHVRADGSIAHALAIGIDSIRAPQVPTGQNVGILIRLLFTRHECDRKHEIELVFQDGDGKRLVYATAETTPVWGVDLPGGWKQGMQAAFNLGLPLPDYGLYSFELLVNGNTMKSIPLRVLPLTEDAQEPPAET